MGFLVRSVNQFCVCISYSVAFDCSNFVQCWLMLYMECRCHLKAPTSPSLNKKRKADLRLCMNDDAGTSHDTGCR